MTGPRAYHQVRVAEVYRGRVVSIYLMGLLAGLPLGSLVLGTLADAIGLRAVEAPYHFRDIHTTILHQLGLEQDELSYLHLGRKERLTLVHGRVIKQIV